MIYAGDRRGRADAASAHLFHWNYHRSGEIDPDQLFEEFLIAGIGLAKVHIVRHQRKRTHRL